MPERLECLGLASAPVERKHELSLERLPRRVMGDERFELGDEVLMVAEREVGFDSRLQRGQPELFEPRGLDLRERLVGDVHESRPSRQRECFTKRLPRGLRISRRLLAPTPGDEPLEAVEIELVGPDPEPVARALS